VWMFCSSCPFWDYGVLSENTRGPRLHEHKINVSFLLLRHRFSTLTKETSRENVRIQCGLSGGATAQAVSRWLPTDANQVRSQVRSCGICGEQCSIGTGFRRAHRFLLPILIPLTAPYSSSIIRGWQNRLNSGRRTKWTQSHPNLAQDGTSGKMF
jgi:hypothetical protein